MAIDKFEEVNEDEERENARGQRGARLRARWRTHPVWFTIGAVVVLYAAALGEVMLRPGRLRGSSVFLFAGLLTLIVFVFLLARLWLQRRARRARSDWT
jgi:hypothetical protein